MLRTFPAVLQCLFVQTYLRADQNATPGELRSDSTPNSISIEWDLSGDSDHDATCNVQYRQRGSEKWLEALPLLRVDYQWWWNTDRGEEPLNLFAGSLRFLEPDTDYELRLDWADPDGTKATKTISVATRPISKLPKDGPTLHVVPGSGGGSGAAENPFRGLSAAQKAAKPGDTFLLHAGDYGKFEFETSGESSKYIAWKSSGEGEAVFSGIRVSASHLWLDGLHLKRTDDSNGLRASDNTEDVVIQACRFDGFHYSITLKPTSRYWHITDNVIVGDNDPNQPTTQGGISGEGVELHHSGVVCCSPYPRRTYHPEWLRDIGGKIVTTRHGDSSEVEVPVLDDPKILAAHLDFIKRLGARYDGHPDITRLDLGSVGWWGEWHMSRSSNATMPTPETRKKIVDAYLAAFQKTPLVMLIGGDEMLRYAVKNGTGWRADSLGDLGSFSPTWNHMFGSYPKRIQAIQDLNAWQNGPIAFEPPAAVAEFVEKDWPLRWIFNYGLAVHGSSFSGKSGRLPDDEHFRQELERFLRRLGLPAGA